MVEYPSISRHPFGTDSDPKEREPLVTKVKSLLQNAIVDYDETFGYGSMTCAVYDTAWVSLVTKTIDGKRQWLFPDSFDYLLDQQAQDGSWGVTGERVDGILSTAAALLSSIRHHAEPLNHDHISTKDLEVRIKRGTDSLHSQLQNWTVASADHVGFELIVPAMLNLLAHESVHLSFDGLDDLMKMHQEKMSQFHPDRLYGSERSTAIHSLEAFIGMIDFDRISHHKTLGSMMGSPSSTAAYLINATVWDDEAEAYLRYVIEHASGKGRGGVPSAYPSTIFEYSWVSSLNRRALVLLLIDLFRFSLRYSLLGFRLPTWRALV